MIAFIYLLYKAAVIMGSFKTRNPVSTQQKKKKEAESAALQKLRSELKLRDARQESIASSSVIARLHADQKELDVRKKELSVLREHRECKRRRILEETGIEKFGKDPTNDSFTVESLKDTCVMLHKINSSINERTKHAHCKLMDTKSSYYNLKLRDDIAKDLLGLLFQPLHVGKKKTQSTNPPMSPAQQCTKEQESAGASTERRRKSRKRLENRREELIDDISAITSICETKKRLHHLRCSSEEWKDKSLENYIDSNIRQIDSEIRDLSKDIQSINSTIKETETLIAERKEEIYSTKKAAKQVSRQDISTTACFQNVVKSNEAMQEQIDEQLQHGEELLKESALLVVDLDDRNMGAEDSDIIVEIRSLLQEQMLRNETGTERELVDNQCADVTGEIEDGEISLRELKAETIAAKAEYDEIAGRLQTVRSSICEMKMKNEACLKLVSVLSQRALETVCR